MDKALSVKQAAEKIGVHPWTIRRWISEGRIRGCRVGPRLMRINPDDVDAMLAGPSPTA